jgi:uncharacterized repeat protein (TIGR03803 family)
MKSRRLVHRWFSLSLIILVFAASASAEWKEKVLYSFQGGSSDGSIPAGGVVFDKAGNLYGADTSGGSGGCADQGCGMVFQVSPPTEKGGAWTETSIYAFRGVTNGGTDGFTPAGGLIIDGKENLYGTTAYGGDGSCVLLGTKAGCGIVYELSPPAEKGGQWTYKILYNFQGGHDGYFPWGNLVIDKAGNLYGATQFGGGKGTTCNAIYGGQCGTVFKLSPPKQQGSKWTEKVLHSFAGIGSGQQTGDGANPNGSLVLDGEGAIYGTTYIGGYNCLYGGGQGCGITFRLKKAVKTDKRWTETVLHRFARQLSDGQNPSAGLTIDAKNNLYGTTLTGGPGGGGTIFRLAPSPKNSGLWAETILYGFTGKGNGLDIEAPVRFDSHGNLYGTASDSGGTYWGTVFRVQPPKKNGGAWSFSLLYGFVGPPDGAQPAAGLVSDKAGNLYSTTTQGGNSANCNHGCGTVFELKK